jgi:ABC-type antimicrobial peptide transport system permease subunit
MMALGAERGRIIGVVYRQALGYAAIGLALGIPASLAAGRFMRTVLWGVGAADPLTYGVIAGGTLAIVAAAVLRPALTAARVDPGSAIREPTG